MKVIDLLNKIANGEEVPKEIKFKNTLYTLIEYDVSTRLYHSIEEPYEGLDINTTDLNDEVEVIEEEPRDIEVCGSLFTRSEYNSLAGIKEDKKIEKLDHKDFTNRFGAEEITDVKLVNKINEIIDKVNKGE